VQHAARASPLEHLQLYWVQHAARASPLEPLQGCAFIAVPPQHLNLKHSSIYLQFDLIDLLRLPPPLQNGGGSPHSCELFTMVIFRIWNLDFSV